MKEDRMTLGLFKRHKIVALFTEKYKTAKVIKYNIKGKR